MGQQSTIPPSLPQLCRCYLLNQKQDRHISTGTMCRLIKWQQCIKAEMLINSLPVLGWIWTVELLLDWIQPRRWGGSGSGRNASSSSSSCPMHAAAPASIACHVLGPLPLSCGAHGNFGLGHVAAEELGVATGAASAQTHPPAAACQVRWGSQAQVLQQATQTSLGKPTIQTLSKTTPLPRHRPRPCRRESRAAASILLLEMGVNIYTAEAVPQLQRKGKLPSPYQSDGGGGIPS